VINGPPLQEDSMAVWDEDLEVDNKQEEKIEPQPEDRSPVMLIQDAGGMDGEEDDDNTDGVQGGSPCKRAKITPECIQHGGNSSGSKKEENYCHNREGQESCQEIKKRTSPIQSATKEGDERSEEKSGVETKSLQTHTVSD
jgi:hypothetical protein